MAYHSAFNFTPFATISKSNFAGVLEKLAAMGYQEVEAGFTDSGEIRVQWRSGDRRSARCLRAPGSRVPSSHFPVPDNDAEWNANIDRAHKLNLQYMLCAGPPGGTDSLDAWKRAAAFFNHLGKLCQKAGIQFAYHNHNHEFLVYDGVIAYDELLEARRIRHW